MQKDWKEISDDDILNFEDSQTGKMSRYDRIMKQKNIESILSLRDKLTGLMQTIYSSSQGMKDRTDKLITIYDEHEKSQGKQQKIIVALTVVIALSTAVYTWITWQSVSAMRESNSIQLQSLELEKIKLQKSNKKNG